MAQQRNPWRSGTVIDCFDDIDVCVVTFCLPCLVFSENRSTLHGGPQSAHDEGIDPCLIYCLIMSVSACTLQCLYAYSTRTDIRRKYNLVEEPCDDCVTHICCHFCALCQEHRELRMYPVTKWPLPASEDTSVVYQGHGNRVGSPVPSLNYIHNPSPSWPQPVSAPMHQRHVSGTVGGSIGSTVPLHYASYSSDMTQPFQSVGGSPYAVQGGGYYAMNQLPTSPPHGGPPRPLVFSTHRAAPSYGGGIIPGIPAEVIQIPKFPDMNRGSSHDQNPSGNR